MFIEADEDMQKLQYKVDYIDQVLFFLDGVLRMINSRTYHIKNAIEEEVSKWFLMNYGLYYKEVVFNRRAMEIVNRIISANYKWSQGNIHNGIQSNRSSQIAWVGDKELLSILLRMVKQINRQAHWNLNITGMEAVQYGKYGTGDFMTGMWINIQNLSGVW